MFKIVKYENEDGECPINNYIENLMVLKKEKEIKKISFYIQLLEEYGYKLPGISKEYAKHLGDQLYELRPGNNRVIYFFYDGDNEYVLLHGFTKKTKKTPVSELQRAKKEKADYERRKKNERK